MASFTKDEEDQGWIDWDLFEDGGVGAFQTAQAIDRTIQALRDRGYGVAEISALASSPRLVGAQSHPAPADGPSRSVALLTDLLRQVSMRYCGWSARNPDAFCDTLRYIDFSGVTGWVLVLRDFDHFFDADAQWAGHAVDVIADLSREHMLRGNRLLALLHAEGRTVDLGTIGGFKVGWQ